MNKFTILFLAVLFCVPFTGLAQWEFESVMPLDSAHTANAVTHGIAVDPDGYVWTHRFFNWSRWARGEGDTINVDGLWRISPDGTTVDTILAVTLADTLFPLIQGRGMRADHNGNILAAYAHRLFRVDYQTHEVLDVYEHPNSLALTTPGVDAQGNIYIGTVLAEAPVRVYDADFNFIMPAITPTGISRSLEVTQDGLTLFYLSPGENAVLKYTRADEFDVFPEVPDTILQGMRVVSAMVNRATGHLWVSAGDNAERPNQYPGVETEWEPFTWYEYDIANDQVLNHITWFNIENSWRKVADGVLVPAEPWEDGAHGPWPRAIAFDNEGTSAYIGHWTYAIIPAIQKWTFEDVPEIPFAGSQSCQMCHGGLYNDWQKSGHAYMLVRSEGANPPVYPDLEIEMNVGGETYTVTPGVPEPPPGLEWEDIRWVNGGFFWKSRFIDNEGYALTGPNRQYNNAPGRWGAWDPEGKRPYNYNCFVCHTTGPRPDDPDGLFADLPGLEGGSWFEAGVGCEACHGPSSFHVPALGGAVGNKPPQLDGFQTCYFCHARAQNEMSEWRARTVNDVPTGFIRHREQGDMMLASTHMTNAGMDCATCHDPHKSVVFKQGGISTTCEDCHTGKEINILDGAGDVIAAKSASCVDCHMPYASRSATQFSPYEADVRGHYWRILTEPITMFENLDTTYREDGSIAGLWIHIDEDGHSGLTLDYSCMNCHIDKDVEWAAQYAVNIHDGITNVELIAGETPHTYSLSQNYPNPFNPTTTINFSVREQGHATLTIYNSIGQRVETLVNEVVNPGQYSVTWDASNVSSGAYFYRLEVNGYALMKRMILIK